MTRRRLKDIQSENDPRNLPINKVGVKDISYPVVVLDRADGKQHTVARVTCMSTCLITFGALT
jgi:GTP cyclohydrolase I